MEDCVKCKTKTYHRVIREFPTLKGKKVWVSCEKCNNIKLRVINNDN
jgi:uncharacterized Zn finger protein